MTISTTKPDSLQPAADMAGDLFDNCVADGRYRARRGGLENIADGKAPRRAGAVS
jgi:hypothetical protein